jgi:hypothetical protein
MHGMNQASSLAGRALVLHFAGMKVERTDAGWADEHPSFPLMFGFAPTLQGILAFHGYECVNVFWSSVFGLGGWAVERLVPPHPPPVDAFGIIVWPVMVWLGLHRLGERLARLPAVARRAALLLYAASLCVVVPIEWLRDILFDNGLERAVPLYFVLWAY